MTSLSDHSLHQSRSTLLRNSLMRLFGPLDVALTQTAFAELAQRYSQAGLRAIGVDTARGAASRPVLIIKRAAADAAPDPIKTMLAQHPLLRRELVLLQADDCVQPSGTGRWLDPRPGMPHHHMRMGNDGDWRRLARRVSRNAVGVVLSASGSGAAAHIGALRAISEAGFPIDMIGGTRAGSLVAAFDHGYPCALDFGAQRFDRDF